MQIIESYSGIGILCTFSFVTYFVFLSNGYIGGGGGGYDDLSEKAQPTIGQS